jgi:hypothetical protein
MPVGFFYQKYARTYFIIIEKELNNLFAMYIEFYQDITADTAREIQKMVEEFRTPSTFII